MAPPDARTPHSGDDAPTVMDVDLSVDIDEDDEIELADAPSPAARDEGAKRSVTGAADVAADVAASPPGDDVPTLIPGVISQGPTQSATDADPIGPAAVPTVPTVPSIVDAGDDAPTMLPGLRSQASSVGAADQDTGSVVGPSVVDADDDAPTMIPGFMSQASSVGAADQVTGSVVGPTIVGAGDDAPTISPAVLTSQAGSPGALTDLQPASPPSSSSSSSSGGFAVVPVTGAESKSAVAEALAGLKPSSSSSSSSSSSTSGRLAVVPVAGAESKSAVAEALAGLKPASRSSSTSGDVAVVPVTGPEPKSAVAEAPGVKQVAPAAPAAPAPRVASLPPTRAPTGSAARPRPTTTGTTTGTTTAGPPSVISEGEVRKAAMVGVVVVVAVVALVMQLLRPTPEPDLPLVRLPISAASCVRLKSVGRALHCEAPAASLNGLPAVDREARLRETRAVARGGGFEQVVFEEKGRVWRVFQLRDAPATTTAPAAPAKR